MFAFGRPLRSGFVSCASSRREQPSKHSFCCPFVRLETGERSASDLCRLFDLSLIHIYIYCRVKTWSKNCLFLSQNLVQSSQFFLFFVFFSKILFFLQGEWDLKEKRPKQRLKKHTFVWVKTWSNYVAQHAWTKFWLNLGPSFDSTFC